VAHVLLGKWSKRVWIDRHKDKLHSVSTWRSLEAGVSSKEMVLSTTQDGVAIQR
jgi:hypothetical protein